MNKFLGLGFGPVRVDTCRPNSLNQAKLVAAIAAIAAKRHVGKAPRFPARDVKVVPIHAALEPSYWMYRRCSDPYTVCFPSNTVRPYPGRDPNSNVRLQMRRDYLRDNSPSTSGN